MPFVVILPFDWMILQDGIEISQPSVNTMSISGSGVPSSIALASAAAPSSEQQNHLPLGSIQAIIAATLEIPDHLIDRTKGNDIHLAYAKYLAIADALAKLSSMSRSGTWKLKNTNDNVIEIFLAKSSYFRNYTKCFSLVKHYPDMKEWLGGVEGAPMTMRFGDMTNRLSTICLKFSRFMSGVLQLKEKERLGTRMILLHLWRRSKHQRRIRRLRGKRRCRRRPVGLVKFVMVMASKYICNNL